MSCDDELRAPENLTTLPEIMSWIADLLGWETWSGPEAETLEETDYSFEWEIVRDEMILGVWEVDPVRTNVFHLIATFNPLSRVFKVVED